MVTPRLTAEQIAQISALVARYITEQRDRYAPRAVALSAEQRTPVNRYFSQTLLTNARLLVLQGERVANPEFYPMLRGLGFNNLPDQSAMAAITFSDTVVAHSPLSDRLLFHELVHVEQYRRLGIPRFAELYVRGFLAGGSYDTIPLEVNAYTLDGRFQEQPDQRFSVEDEVRAWVRDSRF